jgi:hypothetical protein
MLFQLELGHADIMIMVFLRMHHTLARMHPSMALQRRRVQHTSPISLVVHLLLFHVPKALVAQQRLTLLAGGVLKFVTWKDGKNRMSVAKF